MTRYTVFDREGNLLGRHLTAREAMHEILTDDGHRYEIRTYDDGDPNEKWTDEGKRTGFFLWGSLYSSNSGMGGKPLAYFDICSFEADREKALDEIALKVCGEQWQRATAMTDEQYDEMQEPAIDAMALELLAIAKDLVKTDSDWEGDVAFEDFAGFMYGDGVPLGMLREHYDEAIRRAFDLWLKEDAQ